MAVVTIVAALAGAAAVVTVPAGVVAAPPGVVSVPDGVVAPPGVVSVPDGLVVPPGVVVEPPSPGAGAGVSSVILSASVSPAIPNLSVRSFAMSSASFNFISAALICPSNSFT